MNTRYFFNSFMELSLTFHKTHAVWVYNAVIFSKWVSHVMNSTVQPRVSIAAGSGTQAPACFFGALWWAPPACPGLAQAAAQMEIVLPSGSGRCKWLVTDKCLHVRQANPWTGPVQKRHVTSVPTLLTPPLPPSGRRLLPIFSQNL